ncbi:hypothetical protein AMJ85_04465 [candidate division BRC1 bacterium SM23_51]|nr:MAG: hypothetical protein AMJ85_04465 [candidate division BRC1 bacterium SM23_51]
MTESNHAPRRYILREANYRQLLDQRPNVVILPWGATEAHNYHLPYASDVIEAEMFAEHAAALAHNAGAKVAVLPAIPFGANEQQLYQVATINFSATTACAILEDVVRSLTRQGIRRLVVLNAHGGNDLKWMVRDLSSRYACAIVVVNFWQVRPDARKAIFDEPGEHADELETSLFLHWHPDRVRLEQAGKGERIPFAIEGLSQPGVWTPRPWSKCHPDTGCGDPTRATAEKGRQYFDTVCEAIAQLLVNLSKASDEDLPLA